MNVILLGAPGSGKGTQSIILNKKFGFLQLSTGEMIRQNIEEKTESICSDANEFNNRTRALKREMWCKNYIFHLFGCMGVFLIVLIVVLSTMNYN